MKRIIAAAAVMTSAAVTTLVVVLFAPTSNEFVSPCLELESKNSPVLRMDTCTCLAAEMITPLSTTLTLLGSKSDRELRYRATLNVCRAQAFSRSIGAAADVRMSPMPRVIGGPP